MKNIVTYVLLLFLVSCSEKIKSNLDDTQFEQMNTRTHSYSPKDEIISETFTGTKTAVKSSPKLVKSGRIAYRVNDLAGAEEKVSEKIKDYNGNIFSSNRSDYHLSIIIKIPSEKFDDFLKIADSFGKIISKSVNSADVTKEFFDLEERIINKRIHLDKVRKYLSGAKNIDEILKVESEINRITDELESLEGNFNNLSDKTSFSTLTMDFNPVNNDFKEKTIISFSKSMKKLIYYIANFFIVLFIGLIYFVIISVPLALVTGLLYYISFGKLGIIKKYFKNLSTKKSKK